MYYNSRSSIENTIRRARSPFPLDNNLIYDQTIYSAPIMDLPQGWAIHISNPFYFNTSLNISQLNVPLPEIPQRIHELEQLRNHEH